MNVLHFWLERHVQLGGLLLGHLGLTLVSLFLAAAVAIPLGIYAQRSKRVARVVLGLASTLQTVPSIALLGALIPVLGIGWLPALVALFGYALLPIVQNTYTGIRNVDAAVRDSARGVGLTARQVLLQVELPLAAPVILAGLRTAAVINVGVATLAAYVGAGGLGEWIFQGIALDRPEMILAGALPAALLAIGFDVGLGALARTGGGVRALAAAAGVLFIGLSLAPSFDAGAPLNAGFDPEFAERPDGYPRLRAAYPGLRFRTRILNPGLMYRALAEGDVDVISGYSTDGRVRAYDLRVLTDDARAFLPYRAAPLVRQAALDAVPGLDVTLATLHNRLSDSLMLELNYEVDAKRRSPAEVARAWLEASGLLGVAPGSGGPRLRIGGKPFTEQYILTELLAQLIESRHPATVERVGGLAGTDIVFSALGAGDIDAYVEYSGTALQVLLKVGDERVDSLVAADAVEPYLRAAFAKTGLVWAPALGFNNTYGLVVRATAPAKKIGELGAGLQ